MRGALRDSIPWRSYRDTTRETLLPTASLDFLSVEPGGILGTVEEIGVFAIINTLENKKAIVSNSKVTSDIIVNYSANGKIRVDMTFGVGYTDSCLLYTSPSPRDQRGSRMPSSA